MGHTCVTSTRGKRNKSGDHMYDMEYHEGVTNSSEEVDQRLFCDAATQFNHWRQQDLGVGDFIENQQLLWWEGPVGSNGFLTTDDLTGRKHCLG